MQRLKLSSLMARAREQQGCGEMPALVCAIVNGTTVDAHVPVAIFSHVLLSPKDVEVRMAFHAPVGLAGVHVFVAADVARVRVEGWWNLRAIHNEADWGPVFFVDSWPADASLMLRCSLVGLAPPMPVMEPPTVEIKIVRA
jgi:hypothetical protein